MHLSRLGTLQKMRNRKCLYVSGCECRRPLSIATDFLKWFNFYDPVNRTYLTSFL